MIFRIRDSIGALAGGFVMEGGEPVEGEPGWPEAARGARHARQRKARSPEIAAGSAMVVARFFIPGVVA